MVFAQSLYNRVMAFRHGSIACLSMQGRAPAAHFSYVSMREGWRPEYIVDMLGRLSDLGESNIHAGKTKVSCGWVLGSLPAEMNRGES